MAEVFIVDDQPLFLQGLRALVHAAPGLELAGEASHLPATDEERSALADAEAQVLVFGVNSAGQEALRPARLLRQQFQGTALVALAAHPDSDQLFAAIKAGVAAYLPKSVTGTEFLSTLSQVLDGEYPINEAMAINPNVATRVLRQFQDLSATLGNEMEALVEQALVSPLSTRELEILRNIASGLSNKQIAQRLGISEQTIKNHVTSILHKLDANDRTHAVVLALRHGLIAIPQ
ncbi:MAG: response regulator transcription factor [Chloroflexi bacterium]|nr:response regulator transcription factor [Chloroflexota bacterium]